MHVNILPAGSDFLFRPVAAAALPFAAAFCLLLSGCGILRKQEPKVQFEPVQHRAYYGCPRKVTSLVIDGDPGEVAWHYAASVHEFSIAPQHRPPTNATKAWLTWDERFLYVAFDANDPAIEATRTGRDSDTYKDDVLEIFFKTDPQEPDYYNIEINALGEFRDGYNSPESRFNDGWDCPGLEVGVNVDGTLNEPDDDDDGWQLEVAIPFACLPSLEGRAPEAGDVWLFHLARIDRGPRLEEGRELISSAPLETTWFHNSDRWLPLVFQGPGYSVDAKSR
jgi:hypothetical protein